MELGTGPHTEPQALVARCAAGDERAFAELARRFRLGMLVTARQVIDPDAAEDVVQLSLIEANKELRRGVRPDHLGAWLRGITRNVARDQLRARLRTPPPSPIATAPSAHEVMEDRETVRGVVLGVEEELTDLQRNALLAHVMEGKSHKQIALEQGVTTGSVRMAIARAREKLRRRLGGFIPPIGLFGGAAALARKLSRANLGGTAAAGAATVAVAAVAAAATLGGSSDTPARAGDRPEAHATGPSSGPALTSDRKRAERTPKAKGKPRKPKASAQISGPKSTPATQGEPAPQQPSEPSTPAPSPGPAPAPSPSPSPQPSPSPGPQPSPPPQPTPEPPPPEPSPSPPPPASSCGSLSTLIPCVVETVEGILKPR